MPKEIETKYFLPREQGIFFTQLKNNKDTLLQQINSALSIWSITLDPVREEHITTKYRPYLYFDTHSYDFFRAGITFSVRHKGNKGFTFTIKLPTNKGTEERYEFESSIILPLLGFELVDEEKALRSISDFKTNNYRLFEGEAAVVINQLIVSLRSEIKRNELLFLRRLRKEHISLSKRALTILEDAEHHFEIRALKKTIFLVSLDTCQLMSNGKKIGYLSFDTMQKEDGEVLFYEIEIEIKNIRSRKLKRIYVLLQRFLDRLLGSTAEKNPNLSKYQRVVDMIHSDSH